MKKVNYQVVNKEVAFRLGLLDEEFDKIKEILGRQPNFTELSAFSVMWSEHASYKNSIKWLKILPRKGKYLLAEAGKENAGLVDIGEGWAVAFKIESHNHPSAIAPYQGAATGVGGINRDIFTLGARPIAQLNSLRFGNINIEQNKHLIREIVKGIGDYGNSFGVPVVGGEIFFDDSYNDNPLVNAMSVGIVYKDHIVSATAKGKGNLVYIIGSSTGKDGIHGATFASADLTEDSHEDIPSVQVGDPFMEKLLLEASLELAQSGALIGMQDMGAAGIICSTSEMSAKGKSGMIIHLDQVPLRQDNMEPWEIILSESQERMLIVVKKGKEDIVHKILRKWDVPFSCIGEVIDEDRLLFYWNGKLVADIPASSLVLGGGAPQYDREFREPKYIAKTKEFDINQIQVPNDIRKVAWQMLRNPNLVSKRWVYEQYDTMVLTNNISVNFITDAAVVNLKGTNKALVLTTDCNARYVFADAQIGTQIAVAEAARNIICSGGKPVAITNCLNFGNPYNPEVYWQFVGAIKGMKEACERFSTPVTGGNVSFYNQRQKGEQIEAIMPTPVIGMLGILEDKNNLMTISFKEKGDVIFLIGQSRNDINSSEYLVNIHGVSYSPPPFFDLNEEWQLQQILSKLIRKHLINSAHDISDGGLFISLVESAMVNSLGFDISTDDEIRIDAFLFGESQSRVVVTVTPSKVNHFIDFMREQDFPFLLLGHVTKGEMRVDDHSLGFIYDARKVYMNYLEEIMEEKNC